MSLLAFMHWSAIALMGIGVYLAPPEWRGIALVLAAGIYFHKR